MKARVFTILAVVMLFGACPAQAELITIQISGEITDVTTLNVPSSLAENINVGDTFIGTYTYDSATPDSEPDPQIGEYLHDSPYGIVISVSGYEFKTTSNHTDQFVIEIHDNIVDPIHDGYHLISLANIDLDDLPSYKIEWTLADSTCTALSSTALPNTAPILNDWDWNSLIIGGSKRITEGDYWELFYIEGIVTQAIPEPMTGVLLVAGIFFLRRRR